MDDLSNIDTSTLVDANPMAGIKYTGKIEPDAKEEASAILKAFRDRAKVEAQRFRDATDSEYWVAFCFGNRAEKEQFLKALNLLADGDKYIDGRKAAAAMGIELDKTDFRASLKGKRPALINKVGTL